MQSVACHVNTWKCFAAPEDSKIEPTPEIHAKVLRSWATQATCAQALVIWHVISLAQFSLRCYQRVKRCQSLEAVQRSPEEQTEHTLELRTVKTTTIISTQLAPIAHRIVAFAAARYARHTLHRLTRSSYALEQSSRCVQHTASHRTPISRHLVSSPACVVVHRCTS